VFENISAEASMGDKDRQQYKKAVAEAEEKREI
jgi:hypothetical protein